MAWGSVLAAVWLGYALPEANRPSFGMFLAIVLASGLIGLVVPAYLLGLDKGAQAGTTGRQAGRTAMSKSAGWMTKTTTREERPDSAGRGRSSGKDGER